VAAISYTSVAEDDNGNDVNKISSVEWDYVLVTKPLQNRLDYLQLSKAFRIFIYADNLALTLIICTLFMCMAFLSCPVCKVADPTFLLLFLWVGCGFLDTGGYRGKK
jgi:type III secretory pathway component EscR